MTNRSWRVGVIGLGKLGLPVGLAMSLKGHDVMGYDVNPERMTKEHFAERELGPNGEPSIEPLLRQSALRFGTVEEVVRHAEILFVAVQTPHDPRFEGVTRLPPERADFDYSWLRSALLQVSAAVETLGRERTVLVISTVLPGTMRREILPFLSPKIRLVYNPFFIAMGTTIPDFLNPEFVLLGADHWLPLELAEKFYRTLHGRPFVRTSIENAEAVKVFYNTFISTKIAFVNAVMEVCHKIPGCDVDQVTQALTQATDRLISPKYMRAGMGDGGGCHPRDNIALSWLARKFGLSYDWFGNIMEAREKQTEFLADLVVEQLRARKDHRVRILGKAFKPETNLVAGSPARLLASLLEERGYRVTEWDPHVDEKQPWRLLEPGVYVIATKHAEFATLRFPDDSTVIDPFRYIPSRPGIHVIPVGIGGPSPSVPTTEWKEVPAHTVS